MSVIRFMPAVIRAAMVVLITLCTFFAFGCGFNHRTNPAFATTHDQAKEELKDMEDNPVSLKRPVIILGGWGDPGFAPASMAKKIHKATGENDDIITVNYFLTSSFDESARNTVKQVEKQFPSNDPDQTVEVDVIGFSMGGLVARYAAIPPKDVGPNAHTKRLNIKNLYTVSTPHQGARFAFLAAWFDSSARDMKPNSIFLEKLDEDLKQNNRYTMIPYTRLEDMTVGEHNTYPKGYNVIWVDNRPFQAAHGGAAGDRRIIADIARRLRHEQPLAAADQPPLPTLPQSEPQSQQAQYADAAPTLGGKSKPISNNHPPAITSTSQTRQAPPQDTATSSPMTN
ncbi:esterase/lipase family protein [Poriferisphaera sp. WC338]|uniref:esterase/lipase family protein n=1 Tax=Poriferisphaera sp. WC338 TaxID=3425129 RepID=UPI003D815740